MLGQLYTYVKIQGLLLGFVYVTVCKSNLDKRRGGGDDNHSAITVKGMLLFSAVHQ